MVEANRRVASGSDFARRHLERLGGPLYRRQRRAQFMGDVGCELPPYSRESLDLGDVVKHQYEVGFSLPPRTFGVTASACARGGLPPRAPTGRRSVRAYPAPLPAPRWSERLPEEPAHHPRNQEARERIPGTSEFTRRMSPEAFVTMTPSAIPSSIASSRSRSLRNSSRWRLHFRGEPVHGAGEFTQLVLPPGGDAVTEVTLGKFSLRTCYISPNPRRTITPAPKLTAMASKNAKCTCHQEKAPASWQSFASISLKLMARRITPPEKGPAYSWEEPGRANHHHPSGSHGRSSPLRCLSRRDDFGPVGAAIHFSPWCAPGARPESESKRPSKRI